MSTIKTIKEKVKAKLLGELIADLGTLATDDYGRELSLSIRRRRGKRAHLRLKRTGCGETDYRDIVCSNEWVQQFEKVVQEMRRHSGGSSG